MSVLDATFWNAMRIGELIYLDHQATTPVDQRVLHRMMPCHSDSFGNPHSSDHAFGWEAARAVEEASAKVARLIGADPDEIIFTSGATEANNMALLGLGRRSVGCGRRRVIVSAIEHKCVLAAARVLQEQHNYSIEQIPVDGNGFVETSALEHMMDEDVLAVSVMAVNNEIGTIQNIADISKCAHRHGAVFHCDAAQAPIAIPMDTFASQADILTLSGHKMHGPKGIGIIFIGRNLEGGIEPLIHGGGQQGGLRSGTLPVPLCTGMGVAAEILAGTEIEMQRSELRRRRDAFVDLLRELSWPISVNGPEGNERHPGNANVCFHGFSAQDILGAVQPKLAASTGSACTSGITEPSHVLMAIGLCSGKAEASIRFSLGFGTRDDDVEDAAALIASTLEGLWRAGLARTG